MEKERTFKHIKANDSYEEDFCQLGQSLGYFSRNLSETTRDYLSYICTFY